MPTKKGPARIYRSTHQCSTCPWRREVNPADLGGDFGRVDVLKMREKADSGGSLASVNGMSCHRSPDDDPFACVGWLDNQLGAGNNIGLRLQAMGGRFNPRALVLDGEQRESFDEIIRDTEIEG